MSAPPPSSPMITLYTHSLVKWAGKMCLPQQGVSSDRLLLLTRLTLFPGCVTGGGNVPQPREHLATSPPLEIDAVRFDDDGEKGVIRPWAFGAAVILWERRAVQGGRREGAAQQIARPPALPALLFLRPSHLATKNALAPYPAGQAHPESRFGPVR